jgi:hypothetical protein
MARKADDVKKEYSPLRWSPEAIEWLKANRLEIEFCAKHSLSLDKTAITSLLLSASEKKE